MTNFHPTADARQAMRAFVQRAEVRLSTMHRIAGVFLNGAGLLILLPIFFRDAIGDIIEIVWGKIEIFYQNLFAQTLNQSELIEIVLYLMLFIPFLLTLAVPLYTFYLLLKDIVSFYFANQTPGFDERLQNPRFILSGLAFSPDESPESKLEIMRHQYSPELIRFILPFEQNNAQFYDQVYEDTNHLIEPETRHADLLRAQDVFDPANEPDPADFRRFNTALGLAGFLDRSLIEEVARAEITLVRSALCLRRLVLRYIKALLMFVWTTLVSFVLVSFLNTIPPLLVLAVAYIVWAIGTPIVIHLPSKWIWQNIDIKNTIHGSTRDQEIRRFERIVNGVCLLSFMLASITLVVEIARLLNV
ncbi:MAG: hypothetical protein KAX40_07000 [Herpetosiphon sp.]|nr:hypothetical protein [Herpetosiphon sp.]